MSDLDHFLSQQNESFKSDLIKLYTYEKAVLLKSPDTTTLYGDLLIILN